MKRKGQSSVEYIFIVAFALAIIIPAAVLFYRYSADSQENLAASQITRIGNDIVDSAELMFSVGENSWQTLELTVPNQVQSMTIVYDVSGATNLTEVAIRFGDGSSSTALFFTPIPLRNVSPSDPTYTSCVAGCQVYLSPGLNKIRVSSHPSDVVIIDVLE